VSSFPIDLRSLASRVGSWLTGEGPDADVVVSCRVRLARNVEGYPFISRLQSHQAQELAELLRGSLRDARIDGETWWVPMDEAGLVTRLILQERNLVSRELALGAEAADDEDGAAQPAPGRAVAFGETETVSVMVNEEDHLRLQAMAAGNDLDLAWQRAKVLDRYLEANVPFVFTDELGYLTGCPTNVGTGLRASVMLHLPALSLVRSELQKVFTAAQRTGLAVRGMHGEGSRAVGDLYQISNQVTLGRSETQLIDDLSALVPFIVEFERRLRSALVEKQRVQLLDRVNRSFGVLKAARALPADAALAHLSNLRVGLYTGLTEFSTLDVLGALGLQVQKAHVHALTDDPQASTLIAPTERDKRRAEYLRQRLQ